MSERLIPTPPPSYAGLPAGAKAEWLWEQLIGTTAHSPSSLPPLRLPFQTAPLAELGVVMRRQQLERVFTHDGDLMPEHRPKVIHARGAVAMIRFETDPGSAFTGLLAPPPEGGGIGLLRLSLVARVTDTTAFTPGLGLKLLVDGQRSADLLAMNHTVGQGRDFDLFSNSMTNDLSEEHNELRTPQKLMAILFNRVSRRPRRLVLDDFVNRHRDGAAVDRPLVPGRLVFHPTRAARQAFVGQADVDARLVLGRIEPETVLYDVEARTRGAASPIGQVRTTTRFVSSDGGDRLFFRHAQDPADRKPAPVRS